MLLSIYSTWWFPFSFPKKTKSWKYYKTFYVVTSNISFHSLEFVLGDRVLVLSWQPVLLKIFLIEIKLCCSNMCCIKCSILALQLGPVCWKHCIGLCCQYLVLGSKVQILILELSRHDRTLSLEKMRLAISTFPQWVCWVDFSKDKLLFY